MSPQKRRTSDMVWITSGLHVTAHTHTQIYTLSQLSSFLYSTQLICQCLCFPFRSCCRGKEACVRRALGGERLHAGVCGPSGRGGRRITGSPGRLLYHCSPEGSASGHRELCKSQCHLHTGEDTCAQLAAGCSTKPGGGRLKLYSVDWIF